MEKWHGLLTEYVNRIIRSVYLFVVIIADVLMLSRYPFRTEDFPPAAQSVDSLQLSIFCRNCLGWRKSSHPSLLGQPISNGWLIRVFKDLPPCPYLTLLWRVTPALTLLMGLAEASFRLHCAPNNFSLYTTLPLHFPSTGVDIKSTSFLLCGCLPQNLLPWDYWYQQWLKKEGAKMGFWNLITHHPVWQKEPYWYQW